MKNAGTPSGAEADIVIYGMTLSSMNELTVIGATQMYQVNKNTISIQAGDERGMSLIFYRDNFASFCRCTGDAGSLFSHYSNRRRV